MAVIIVKFMNNCTLHVGLFILILSCPYAVRIFMNNRWGRLQATKCHQMLDYRSHKLLLYTGLTICYHGKQIVQWPVVMTVIEIPFVLIQVSYSRNKRICQSHTARWIMIDKSICWNLLNYDKHDNVLFSSRKLFVLRLFKHDGILRAISCH